MKYKLICTDMDGTLLNSVKEVSKGNLEAIKKAHDKGVKIAICTGRIFTSAKYYGELIGIKAPIIASNGAYIREKDENNVIYKCILEKDNCFEILEIFEKYNLIPHFYTEDSIYAGETSYVFEFYSTLNKTVPDDFQIKIKKVDDWEEIFIENEFDILKAVAFDEDVEKIKKVKEEIRALGKYEVVSSLHNNFEVMNKNVSKGRAVEMLASYYNLSKDEVITIGDNENDLSMIEYAGLGVAMGNGEKIVKDKAEYITSTNDEDGVKEVIEKFILNENT
ncbi:MAG: HAD family phosphatase [Clostridium argentinense]|uniref:HAD family phosphatase n=1 Tax=Clostridium faecium TaxID=2762223 RepID=A0ABR8YW73_9CLOT|nr:MULTISPECIES: Cof-type HAD-IIB family hydrolase [Clostridium]MBD8048248.1 HAD family phosphatase [Clostridium faecium]MBS5823310.1 HAD family phosphatase [Clostridium argentinense]MDU1349075.1 Cof-type HAD-IIB family hydrolase [Clostridium argentinense]